MALLSLACSPILHASFCSTRIWTLNQISDAPTLAVGRVVSLEMEGGSNFTGNSRRSAVPQMITANVEILRSTQQAAMSAAAPKGIVKIRFLGRDGPDFSFCPRELPELLPGHVLLLPLQANSQTVSAPWQLFGAEGRGLATRVEPEMRPRAEAPDDPRSFVIREIVNSLQHGVPLAAYAAATLVATQADYLEPDLTSQLEQSIGDNAAHWARVLAYMVLAYPGGPLTLDNVRTGRLESNSTRFTGLPLAQLAIRHLTGKRAETLIWQSLMGDLAGLADEPYHPLFSYSSSFALHSAVAYLSRQANDTAFVDAVKTALRKDRPGSSFLAARLIDAGQKGCLSEALHRAIVLAGRPTADGDDLAASVRLVANYGSADQRRKLASVARGFSKSNPEYSAFLLRNLPQASMDRL